VTKWSKFDTRWEGVRFRDVLAVVDPDPLAAFIVEHAEFGYTTNLPLADLLGDDTLIAWAYDGNRSRPCTAAPSAWWCRRATSGSRRSGCAGSSSWPRPTRLLERNGYHNDGDPWREQRFWGD